MTGNQLAAALKREKGKVAIQMMTPNEAVWVFAEKSDLIAWATQQGGNETNMKLSREPNGASLFLETIY